VNEVGTRALPVSCQFRI